MADLEDIRISELESLNHVDKDNDILVVSHPSTAYSDDYKSYKVTPHKLLSDVGLAYTAGDHINISSDNVISATYSTATTNDAGLMSSDDKTKLNGIEANANNYSLPIATTEIVGGVKQGTNITIANDGTISAQQKTYTAGTNVQISDQNVISATDTTYSDATQQASGLMSFGDKTKLDGIATNANNYTLPVATSGSLGGVKQGANVTIANDGTISVAPPGASAVSGLSDVSLSSLSNGEILKYNSSTSKWENATESGGGASALDDLTDVTITSPAVNEILKYDGTTWVNGAVPGNSTSLVTLTDTAIASQQDGQTLVYDSNSSKWINGNIPLSNLSDTTISSATNGQVLTYDSSAAKWKNASIPTPSTPALDDLTDVTITSATDGQALVYDNANSTWVNGTVASSVSTLSDVTLSSLADGEILKYDSATSKWVNSPESGGGASDLEDLGDVDITTPQEGDTLVYDSTNSKWVNGAGGGGGSAKQTAVTQAQYDALVQAGTVDPTMEYFITDGIPAQVFPWTEITGTLTTGQTSIVFSNATITTNSTVDIYVDDSFYGVNPTAVVIANGSVTLTFNEQAVDIPVKVRIS